MNIESKYILTASNIRYLLCLQLPKFIFRDWVGIGEFRWIKCKFIEIEGDYMSYYYILSHHFKEEALSQ